MAALRVAALLALVACVGTEGPPPKGSGGTLVISTVGDPDILIPPLTSTVQGTQITDLVFDRLAEIGDSLNIVGDVGFTPRLSNQWTWRRDSLSIAFHIDERARWHDGQPVQAKDVRFTFLSYKDTALGSPFAALITNIDSVTTPDSSTAVFWFRSRTPQQFYDAVYPMPIMPEHIWRDIPRSSWRASERAKAPVGSGRFRFVRWTPRQSVELEADPLNYQGAPKLTRAIWSLAPDFNTAVTRFLSGETDFFEGLRSEHVPEVARVSHLRIAKTRGSDYTFAQFNFRDPSNRTRPHSIFGDRELRRALTMALDRNAIVRNVFDTFALPALGPTVRAYQTTDPNLPQIPFNLERARLILDSLEWRDADGDGVREKNGRPLQFRLAVPGSSRARTGMAVLLQEQWRQAGVKVDVEQMDFPAFVNLTRTRAFDVVIGGWHTHPSPGGVRQTWSSMGSRSPTGSNYGAYENPVFDAYVDSALASHDLPTRRALFTRAYEIIIQDAPAIWLAELIPTMGYHSRLQLAPLRPDAWWAHIPEWWIPEDRRLPRDNAPLSTPSSTPSSADSAGRKAP
ncbi:MAG: peptide ABC transporter substrate-binding protein [Gemmatimonadaceae bacterium]